MSDRTLPLSDLDELRFTHPLRREVEDLKQSIALHGFRGGPGQRLWILVESDDGSARVGEGHHRLAALRALAAEGQIPRDYPVPVVLRYLGNADLKSGSWVPASKRAVVPNGPVQTFFHGTAPERVPQILRDGFDIDAQRRSDPGPWDEDDMLTPNRTARLDQVFDEAFDEIDRQFPDFGVAELHEDEMAASDNGAGSERQYAYCKDGDPIIIAFAPKAHRAPLERLRGLMRHEFGHALEYRFGVKELERRLGRRLPAEVERRADAIAEAVWGEPIVYDEKLVQCVGREGIRPRPAHLPDEKAKLKANPPPGQTFTAYHASTKGIPQAPTEFRSFRGMDYGPGFYLGTEPRDLDLYGDRLYEATVRMSKPLVISHEEPVDWGLVNGLRRALRIDEDMLDDYPHPLVGIFSLANELYAIGSLRPESLIAALQKKGYDGVYVDGDIVNDHQDMGLRGDYLAIWSPEQIVSWEEKR